MKYLHIGFTHLITQICILIFAVFVLFSEDFEIFLPETGKIVFIRIRDICFVFFSLEFIISILIEENYIPSLFFFMDLIDLISLLTETGFIWTPILSLLDRISM